MSHRDLHGGYQTEVTRQIHAANTLLTPAMLWYPLFVTDAPHPTPISALKGVSRVPAADIASFIAPLVAKGLAAVLLFGVLENTTKDDAGACALRDDSPVVIAAKVLKKTYGDRLMVACDLCICTYSSHGHCGLFCTVDGRDEPLLDVAASGVQLARMAAHFAKAGCDVVAPSDMMDGRIAAIKAQLRIDGLAHRVGVMSYSAKFASKLYGPFREAADSSPAFGDRRCYQLPPGARQLAMRAVKRDLDEGADFVMVKPGTLYLDVIRDASEISDVPVAVYHVSGEYAGLCAAADAGVVDFNAVLMETMTAFRRAGASIIITYAVPQLLDLLATGRE